MMFEWIADPSAWAGLATLVLLEIVLGLDNLVFIAILAEKLPPQQRNKARMIGLSLALGMRLVLLASIAWIVTLTEPLFSIGEFGFSGRDLILIFGGLFLLFKGTLELHERLEGHLAHQTQKPLQHAAFWVVIAQIVVLDAVFSLDSVITAVGMVDHLSVMMIAVIIAVLIMMVASKPLMAFVSRHPNVIILCLGFLMMIGFSLLVEGLGYHIPKGYLYAAIGFSILVEAFNQAVRRNRERFITSSDLRERTADAVLSLLGGKRSSLGLGETVDVIAEKSAEKEVFAPEEKEMIQGVLTLADRPIKSIMTPRPDIDWLNIEDDADALHNQIKDIGHSRLPIAKGSLENLLGVAATKDILHDLLLEGAINLERSIRQPLIIHESMKVLRVMKQLRESPLQMAIVLDEYGSVEGIATPLDILEAIAGEFPDESDELSVQQQEDGSWLVDALIDAHRISQLLNYNLVDDNNRYSTLAGFLLAELGHLPEQGEQIIKEDLCFEVVAVTNTQIERVRISRQS
ncbi:MAG TPA: TerC family protein [Agitococcus sp.]|nr:TerC family protein [Agitococcus sp.]